MRLNAQISKIQSCRFTKNNAYFSDEIYINTDTLEREVYKL